MLYFFPKRDKSKATEASRIVVVSHGLVKERAVPDVEIGRAIERKTKFEADPGRHTFKPTVKR